MKFKTITGANRLIFLVVFHCAGAVAGLDEGKKAYDGKQYSLAMKELTPIAEQGDPKAQSLVGMMYASGQGVPVDYALALSWFSKAAEQGNADAQANLGVMYEKGRGVKQDHVQAIAWYRKAADRGHDVAQYVLGSMYIAGTRVSQDYPQAADWYRKAAEQGNVYARFNLGLMYQNGHGVQKNRVVAHALYSLPTTIELSVKGFQAASALAKEMTSQEIDDAKGLAKEMVKTKGITGPIDNYFRQLN